MIQRSPGSRDGSIAGRGFRGIPDMLQGLRNERRPPYGRETFGADLKAGVTLVASVLPTVMALGVISGMGPLAGL